MYELQLRIIMSKAFINEKPIGYKYNTRAEAKKKYSRYQTVEGYWLHYVPDEKIEQTMKEIHKRNNKIHDRIGKVCYMITDELDVKQSIKTKVDKIYDEINEMMILNNFALNTFYKSDYKPENE